MPLYRIISQLLFLVHICDVGNADQPDSNHLKKSEGDVKKNSQGSNAVSVPEIGSIFKCTVHHDACMYNVAVNGSATKQCICHAA